MAETNWNLTAKALAAAYGVHPSTIYRNKLEGHLPYFQPGGKRHFVRFPKTLLEIVSGATNSSDPKSDNTEKPIPGPKPTWLAEDESAQ